MGDFSEKSLETMMFENKEALKERGFDRFYKKTERQFRLPNGCYIDLFTYEIDGDHLKFRVIELKKGQLNFDAYSQLCGYFCMVCELVQRCFSKITYECILIGESLGEDIQEILLLGSDVSVYTYSFGYDGLFFKYWNKYADLEPGVWGDIPADEPFRVKSETFSNYLRKNSL